MASLPSSDPALLLRGNEIGIHYVAFPPVIFDIPKAREVWRWNWSRGLEKAFCVRLLLSLFTFIYFDSSSSLAILNTFTIWRVKAVKAGYSQIYEEKISVSCKSISFLHYSLAQRHSHARISIQFIITNLDFVCLHFKNVITLLGCCFVHIFNVEPISHLFCWCYFSQCIYCIQNQLLCRYHSITWKLYQIRQSMKYHWALYWLSDCCSISRVSGADSLLSK